MRVRDGEDGLTLIEVLVALGVLAGGVLLVASLLTVGQARFRGGGLMTQSVAVAERILEDLNGMGYAQLPEIFPDCCPAGCTTAVGCVVESNLDTVAAARWGPLVADLPGGFAEAALTPLGGDAEPSTFGSAEAVRVVVRVAWREGSRSRSVELVTVRF